MPSSNRIAYSKHSCQNRNCNEPRSFVRCHLHHMIGSILFYAGPTCNLLYSLLSLLFLLSPTLTIPLPISNEIRQDIVAKRDP